MKSGQGVLYVISGPSAVGKGSICKRLLEKDASLKVSISATTRQPRGEELHGKEYFFYSDKEFEDMIRQDAFLEWAQVFNRYYGTPRVYVEEILASGKDCILEIDVQGALQVKEKYPGAVLIFIMPPSREALMERIRKRGTEKPEEIQKRISQADAEMARRDAYQYVLVNDDLDRAVDEAREIIFRNRQEEAL
jgi:guanylate kinase